MLNDLQYRILRKIAPGEPQTMNGSAYDGKSKIRVSLGDDLLTLVRDKTVIDFGCGDGVATLDLARHGAKKVIGLDIRQNALDQATRNAASAGLGALCEFSTSTDTKAEIIVSLDAFEHFGDPAAILQIMHNLLKPGGCVMASFGPTWYHPLGGHLFSVFPWSHLLFSEASLIRWRANIRPDGATRFSEVDGGLNQMTIARFERLVSASQFRIETSGDRSNSQTRPDTLPFIQRIYNCDCTNEADLESVIILIFALGLPLITTQILPAGCGRLLARMPLAPQSTQ